MDDCQIFALHGWGFNHTFWEPWADALADFGNFTAYERGYFSRIKDQENSFRYEASPTIIITHSFGLHWVSEELLEKTDLLIINSGFLHFHPRAAQYRRRSRQMLKEMINKFEVYPENVLSDFYKNCYAPEDEPDDLETGSLHQLQMLDDLEWLNEAERAPSSLKRATKICILHGTEDHIVPHQKGRQMYNQLKGSRYFEVQGAGHALPFTHKKKCLSFVIPEVERICEDMNTN